MARTYTIREAAEISTKSYAALRGMVDRGQIETIGGGKHGRTRRISHDELRSVGLLRADELHADSAVQELSLRLNSLNAELREVEARLASQLARIEVLLTKDEQPAPEGEGSERAADEATPKLKVV